MNWLITLPLKQIDVFTAEIEHCKTMGDIKNFRIPQHIGRPKKGDTVYIVWNGKVRWKVPCLGCEKMIFRCTTTGIPQAGGNYLKCELARIEDLPDGESIRGFQGIRKYTAEA